MLSSRAAQGRWTACFSLAVFQTIVGIAVASLAVTHMVLANVVQGGQTPHVDACHDSTIAAVLQGITLVVAGSLGVWAYAPFLAPAAHTVPVKKGPSWYPQPRLVLVASHVLFSAVVAFVGYNAAASHGCFALGKGGEKAIFGVVVARVVLSYLCHIVGGLCAGLAMPDLCRAIIKGRQHQNPTQTGSADEDGFTGGLRPVSVQRVVERMNSQTAIVTTESRNDASGEKTRLHTQQMLTVITLPDMKDGSTIYAVPQDQFVVQQQDGSVSIPEGTSAPSMAQRLSSGSVSVRLTNIPEQQPVEVNITTSAENAKLVP